MHYRSPRTTQERRANVRDATPGVTFRRRRLPDSCWSDLGRDTSRTWKRQRKTKWR